MKNISLNDVENIAFALAQEHLAFDEPIPDFTTRFPNILESCVATPFMKYDGKFLYKGLVGKAAILLYLMIKNHPFQNGNKRIALMTTLVYLAKNGKWMRAQDSEFYDLAIWVAISPPVVKDFTVEGIQRFIEKHLDIFRPKKSPAEPLQTTQRGKLEP